MMSETKQIDWETLVTQAEPRPVVEVVYEFPNNRKFVENFRPTNGPYEPEEPTP